MSNESEKVQLEKGYYGSPRWTAEIADCSLPMTFDTYSNCSFGCVYCFSQFQRAIGGCAENYLAKKVKAVNIERVKQIFTGERESQFWEYIKTKRPLQWGGLSDQFDGFERHFGKTLELMKFFKEINYPISFSTKATWVFDDERYVELFKGQDNWNMKFSIITLNEEYARKIEVGVPSPRERLNAMEKYSKMSKGGATLRLRPFIVGVSSKDYEELIREAHKAGATAVTTEFFCLEMRVKEHVKDNYKIISDCAGFDIVEFYKKYSTNKTGYLRLSRKVKEKYIKRMKELCDELGMRFYVSDAHFKEACNNACCCGLPDTEQFNYSKGQFSQALQIAKSKGQVLFSDIEKDMYFLDFKWVGASGYNTRSVEARSQFKDMTMRDYMRYLWNNPNNGQSPNKLFEGVLKPNGYDEEGNIIYIFNEKVTFIKKGNEAVKL